MIVEQGDRQLGTVGDKSGHGQGALLNTMETWHPNKVKTCWLSAKELTVGRRERVESEMAGRLRRSQESRRRSSGLILLKWL